MISDIHRAVGRLGLPSNEAHQQKNHDSAYAPAKSRRIVTVANLKGGSGKTTLTGCLFMQLRQMRLDVGLIDTDPAGGLNSWLNSSAPHQALQHSPLGELSPDMRRTPQAPHVDGPRKDWATNAKAHAYHHHVTLIDLPAASCRALLTAAAIADICLVPMCANASELRTSESSLALLRDINRWRRTPVWLAIVPNRIHEPESLAGLHEWAAGLKVPVLPALSWQPGYAACQNAASMPRDQICRRELKNLSRCLARHLGL